MKKKQLGNTDMMIAPVTFGGNVFGWTIDERTSFELLDTFSAAGFNLIDTADVYSRWMPGNTGGESETIIGNWIKQRKRRNDIYIATKTGGDMGKGKSLRKQDIIRSAENSLLRLQTDHIDLYQTHFDDEHTAVEETLEAYAQLVKDGKVKYIGTSNMSAGRLKQSLLVSATMGYPAYQSLQPEYNLYSREKFETEYEQLCLNNNIGVINYYALASGFLTGKYRSEADLGKSARGGGIKKYLNERGLQILNALDSVSLKYNTTPAAIAIAWLISRPVITSPIASATNTGQLKELLSAALLELNSDDIKLLNEASTW